MRLRNLTTGEVIATQVNLAKTWIERVVGLLPASSIEPSQGVWLTGCNVIHTVGMQDRIDVIFLDNDGRVLRTVCSVPKNRLALMCRGARSVVELGDGALEMSDVLVGDRFALEE